MAERSREAVELGLPAPSFRAGVPAGASSRSMRPTTSPMRKVQRRRRGTARRLGYRAKSLCVRPRRGDCWPPDSCEAEMAQAAADGASLRVGAPPAARRRALVDGLLVEVPTYLMPRVARAGCGKRSRHMKVFVAPHSPWSSFTSWYVAPH